MFERKDVTAAPLRQNSGTLWSPGALGAFCCGRHPRPCSAVAVMYNRAYLSPLQIRLPTFAFSICWVVIWYGRGHWQLFLCSVELSHDAGAECCFWLSVRVHVLLNNPMRRCLPADQQLVLLLPSKSSCTTSPNPSHDIRGQLGSATCGSRFYSGTGDIWGVARCFHRRSRDFAVSHLLKASFSSGIAGRLAEACLPPIATCLDLMECEIATAPMAFCVYNHSANIVHSKPPSPLPSGASETPVSSSDCPLPPLIGRGTAAGDDVSLSPWLWFVFVIQRDSLGCVTVREDQSSSWLSFCRCWREQSQVWGCVNWD